MNYDDAYANAAYIPNAEGFVETWAQEAEAFRARALAQGRAEMDIPYGSSARQKFDLFAPKQGSQGVLIFVHGGYWLKFDKSSWSHLAKGAVERGWHVALPSYDLCPEVGIHDISRQIARAVQVIADRCAGAIVLAGHSAGGHLVSRMGVGDLLPDALHARIAHVMAISPVSDLRPLLKTAMNRSFKMDMAAAEAESPALMPKPSCKVTVWVGADERPVFLDQARWLSQAWDAPLVVDADKHHFDVIEGLSDSQSQMTSCLLDV
ncbi:MAG: alpha/beta hydrolase [Paracoccaceae bacterium]|nr:alpha/beta hydrolase [Paracoccaceae bacterium]